MIGVGGTPTPIRSTMATSRVPIGVVTIGQAPRPDMMSDLRSILGDDAAINEAGALDLLSADEIHELGPRSREFPLISRLRDGTVVELSRARIIGHLQGALDRLAAHGARIFVILCTGEFPPFRAPGPVLLPQRVLAKTVEALGVRTVGVLPPLAEQVGEVRDRWTAMAYDAVVVPASPYGDDAPILDAARQLRDAEVDVVVLDCQAYRLRHREVLRSVIDCPILVPNAMVARYLQELVA